MDKIDAIWDLCALYVLCVYPASLFSRSPLGLRVYLELHVFHPPALLTLPCGCVHALALYLEGRAFLHAFSHVLPLWALCAFGFLPPHCSPPCWPHSHLRNGRMCLFCQLHPPADPGGPPLPPRFFPKSCSFWANLRKKLYFEQILGSGPPLGSKLCWSPWPKSWIRPWPSLSKLFLWNSQECPQKLRKKENSPLREWRRISLSDKFAVDVAVWTVSVLCDKVEKSRCPFCNKRPMNVHTSTSTSYTN